MTVFYFIVGILGIDILIIVHEIGHFAACRLCKVRVESLSVGLGKVIWKTERNGTAFLLRMIPFGGATKMAGQEDLQVAIETGRKDMDNSTEGSIYSASPLQRVIIYAMGPLFNIIFAAICLTVFLCMPSKVEYYPPRIVLSADYQNLYDNACPAAISGLRTGDFITSVNGEKTDSYSELSALLKENNTHPVVLTTADGKTYSVIPENGVFGILPFREPVVGAVEFDSNEYRAGLRQKDRILTANGIRVTNMFDILSRNAESDLLTLEVQRDGKIFTVSFETSQDLSFSLLGESRTVRGESFGSAVKKALLHCVTQIQIFSDSIVRLARGQSTVSQTLGGTIYASENFGMMTTRAFEVSMNMGLRVAIYMLGTLSISLAAANFLPISALDGGLILISVMEFIFRRTFSPKTYITLQVLGLITIFVVIPIAKLLF